MKFRKGVSGNPAGKPKGAKDKRTELRNLLSPHATDLVNKAVDLALKGDVAALRLCLERMIPPFRAQDEAVVVDGLTVGDRPSDSADRVLNALGQGDITPDQAIAILTALLNKTRIVEADDLQKRVENLEVKHGKAS